MANRKVCSTDMTAYREPENDDLKVDVDQLLSGALQIDQYAPVQHLELIKSDGRQALVNSHFSTPQEKKTAELIQSNTDAWIDTAKDVLMLAVDVGGIVSTCASTAHAGSVTPPTVARLTQHLTSTGETLRRIYNRSCEMAIANSHELLEAIGDDEHVGQNLSIKAAAEQHQSDLERFQRGEVSASVPHRSHAELNESIRKAEPNPEAKIRQKAEKSSRAWETVIYLGGILAAVGVIIGFALLKK